MTTDTLRKILLITNPEDTEISDNLYLDGLAYSLEVETDLYPGGRRRISRHRYLSLRLPNLIHPM
jgi:hypothetical protein